MADGILTWRLKGSNCPIYNKFGYNHFFVTILKKLFCVVAVYTIRNKYGLSNMDV